VDETTQITMKKYEILPYKTEWPLEFQEIAVGLRSGLGSHALRIDHIGSTSVQDLAAKDVIDIQTPDEISSEKVERLIIVDTNRWDRLDRLKNLKKK